MSETKKSSICAATALFVAVCIFLGTLFAATVRADEEEHYFPTLYCNDEVWYKSDIYPLDRYFQLYYMPVSILGRFDGITVSENERFGTLLISYSGARQTNFISFNLNTDLAVTDKLNEFYAMIYTKDDEYYVPVDVVCSALGLTTEFYRHEITGEVALRVCNGNQKKTFEELIQLYSYSESSDTTIEDDPYVTTDPSVTDPPAPIDAKTLYITFDDVGPAILDGVLAELKSHGKRATFFVTQSTLQESPVSVIKMIAAGHSVGLLFDVDGYAADPVSSFQSQNDMLVRMIKHGSRFVRLCGNTELEAAKQRVRDAEYTVWDWNIDLKAETNGDIMTNLAALEKSIEENEVLVMRFVGNDHCLGMLGQVLDYIDQNINCSARTINDATQAID